MRMFPLLMFLFASSAAVADETLYESVYGRDRDGPNQLEADRQNAETTRKLDDEFRQRREEFHQQENEQRMRENEQHTQELEERMRRNEE